MPGFFNTKQTNPRLLLGLLWFSYLLSLAATKNVAHHRPIREGEFYFSAPNDDVYAFELLGMLHCFPENLLSKLFNQSVELCGAKPIEGTVNIFSSQKEFYIGSSAEYGIGFKAINSDPQAADNDFANCTKNRVINATCPPRSHEIDWVLLYGILIYTCAVVIGMIGCYLAEKIPPRNAKTTTNSTTKLNLQPNNDTNSDTKKNNNDNNSQTPSQKL